MKSLASGQFNPRWARQTGPKIKHNWPYPFSLKAEEAPNMRGTPLR